MEPTFLLALIIGYAVFLAECAYLWKTSQAVEIVNSPVVVHKKSSVQPEPLNNSTETTEDVTPVTETPVTETHIGDVSIANSQITVGGTGDKYAKEHCHYLASNGHDLSHLALMGPLYHEAVEALRRGELPVNSGPDSADAIDDWVAKRLLESEVVPFMDENSREVVIGDLYRQAVDLLRRGKIPLLGAKTTADKLETWVRREQLKRCGVKL